MLKLVELEAEKPLAQEVSKREEAIGWEVQELSRELGQRLGYEEGSGSGNCADSSASGCLMWTSWICSESPATNFQGLCVRPRNFERGEEFLVLFFSRVLHCSVSAEGALRTGPRPKEQRRATIDA